MHEEQVTHLAETRPSVVPTAELDWYVGVRADLHTVAALMSNGKCMRAMQKTWCRCPVLAHSFVLLYIRLHATGLGCAKPSPHRPPTYSQGGCPTALVQASNFAPRQSCTRRSLAKVAGISNSPWYALYGLLPRLTMHRLTMHSLALRGKPQRMQCSGLIWFAAKDQSPKDNSFRHPFSIECSTRFLLKDKRKQRQKQAQVDNSAKDQPKP